MLGDFFKDAVQSQSGAEGAPRGKSRTDRTRVAEDPRLDPLAPLPESDEAEETAEGGADGDEAGPDGSLPAEEPEAPPAESFTSIQEEDLPVEARGVFRTMKQDFENRLREIEGLRSGAERTTQYAALLDRIEKDDTLRNLIVGHLQGQQGQPGQAAPVAPPETILDRAEYPELDDEEFAAEEARAQKMDRVFQKRYGARLEQHEGTVKKVDSLMERVEAQREMQELESAHPDWAQHVDPRDLIREKQAQPHRSVRSLYRELDYDKAIARSRRAVFAGGRKSERSVAAAGAGRGSQPPDRIKGINNFADGIAAAIEELGYKTA